MRSLKSRVMRQRDTVLARGPDIRFRAERVRARLRHPGALIPAFLAGMLVARVTPLVLYALPRLTARVRQVTEDLRKFDASMRLFFALTATRQQSRGTEVDVRSSPKSDVAR